MPDKLPFRGRSANLGSPGKTTQSPRGRTTSQMLADTAGAIGGRPPPSRRLSAHGSNPTIATSGRLGARRSQSHEPTPRFPTLSSPGAHRQGRGRTSRSPNRTSAGRDAATPRSLQSPSRYGRPDGHLRPSGSRRDSYGSPSALAGRLLREEQRPSERGRRYSFSPSSPRPAPRQRTYSSEHFSPPFRSAGRVSSPLSPDAASPMSPRWRPTEPHRTSTPPRHRPFHAESHGSSSRRPSFGDSTGRHASNTRPQSVRGSGASSREPSRGRRGSFLSTIATVAGIEGLVKHATTAQQWTEWLSDLQDSPDEIRSLSDKATTARDTVAQIEATLAARPDLLEGESGQRLKQHIGDAINSTNETLSVMTRLLADLSQTTAEEGTVLRGLQEYWNSYRYKSEWGGKLKEVEGQLQDQLAQLGTLMINIYSRALTKPAPRDASLDIPASSRHEEPTEPNPATTAAADSWPLRDGTSSKHVSAPSTNENVTLPDKIIDKSSQPTRIEPPTVNESEDYSAQTVNESSTRSEHSQHISSPAHNPPGGAEMARRSPISSPRIVELPPSQDGPDETRRQSVASAVTDSEDPEEVLLDAVWNGDMEAVTRALQHASPKSTDTRGMTPLHYAAERDRLAIAMLLLDRGAEINSTTDRARTALHLAARSASADMVEMLLERAGADPNARTSDGKTPLHYAASSATEGDEDRRDVIRVLRDWRVDPTIKDRKGDTARDVAQKRDHWDAAATLRRAEKRWEETHRQNWLQRHGIKK